MITIRETETGIVFHIRVVPRASRCEPAGIQDDALKLRITAPPIEGRANGECLGLLSNLFGVKKKQVKIIAGHASRTKTIAIAGIDARKAAELIGTM